MKLTFALATCASAQFADTPWKVDNFNNLDEWNINVVPNSHNNEYQYYTNRYENVHVEDGVLKIFPKREKYEHRDYTSAKLTSKFHATFGKIEIMAKNPKGRGLWPAIWMMPQDSVYGGWPASGEIDIYEGRGQDPHEIQSTIHYGGIPCCDQHRYTGSGRLYQNVDTTQDFHKYTVEWTPKNFIFKFDDEYKYEINIDKIMQGGTYHQNGQPFDKDFYLILNVAIGGDFLDGPDPWDNWNYPDAEMWFDSVKWYEYTGGDNNGPPIGEDGMECKAKDTASDGELCGNAKWACYDQNYAPNMAPACTSEWQNCCYNNACSHNDVVRTCSAVYEQYDAQLRDATSCDFSGTAYRVYCKNGRDQEGRKC